MNSISTVKVDVYHRVKMNGSCNKTFVCLWIGLCELTLSSMALSTDDMDILDIVSEREFNCSSDVFSLSELEPGSIAESELLPDSFSDGG